MTVAAAAAGALLLPGARRLPTDQELRGLEARLGVNFTDPWLLRQALVHPSFGEFNNARWARPCRRVPTRRHCARSLAQLPTWPLEMCACVPHAQAQLAGGRHPGRAGV